MRTRSVERRTNELATS